MNIVIALLFSSWLLPASGAGAREEAKAPPGLLELRREILPLMTETEALGKRLEALRDRYPNIKDVREVSAEREELRRELQGGLDRLEALRDTVNALLMGSVIAEAQSMLSDGRPGSRGIVMAAAAAVGGARVEGWQDDPDASMDNAMAMTKFASRIKNAVYSANGILKMDDIRFEEARRNLDARRFRRNAALLVSIVLLAALSAAYALLSSRGAGETALPPGPIPAVLGAPAGVSLPTTAPGNVLGGKFQIVRELGRGGMGLVYEALDLTLRRRVAVKQMREDLCQSPGDMERFLEEARVTAELRHPNIVEIHGVVREGGRVFLVFEHVSGRSLSALLERGPVGFETLRAIIAQAASALDYAHSRGVIHRDLKPANIMVTDRNAVKVMDFGLAHRARLSAARLSRTGIQGTFAYMAPEQESGSVSRESDLFSLAACAYELAVGREPFPGPNFLAQKREMHFIRPSKAAAVPPGFDAFIERALHPDPARRFHSGSELSAALTAVAEARPG